MKRVNKLLSSILIASLVFPVFSSIVLADTGVPLDKDHFPDDRFRESIKNLIDKDNSNTLSEEEISSLTYLVCRNGVDSTIKGVEYLTALKYLDCSSCSLTSLDVSNNQNLKELICSENQIVSLNLSHNPSLEHLQCWENPLSSLVLAADTNLSTINCDSTDLVKLDLSNVTSLTELSCRFVPMQSLNVEGCTSLKKLNCSRCQLTSLDVSTCENLHDLYCIHNFLNKLDVSKCPYLSGLWCEENEIEVLDLSNNLYLDHLDCYSNKLTSLILPPSRLEHVHCYYNNLSKLDISELPREQSILEMYLLRNNSNYCQFSHYDQDKSVLIYSASSYPNGFMLDEKTRVISGAGIEYVLNNHKYQVVEEEMTWEEAEAYCESKGGHLATLTYTQEVKMAADNITRGNDYWLGAYSKGDKISWVTDQEFHEEDFWITKPSEDLYCYTGMLFPIATLDFADKDSTAFFICEWDDSGEIDMLGGFDFENDTFDFGNTKIKDESSKRFCKYMFSILDENTLWDTAFKVNGRCYGYTVADYSFLNGYMDFSRLSSTHIRDVKEEDIYYDDYTVSDVLDILQLLQWVPTRDEYHYDDTLDDIYEKIKRESKSESGSKSLGMMIDCSDMFHAISCIGIIEDTFEHCVLAIYDTNTPSEIQRLQLNKYPSGKIMNWEYFDPQGKEIGSRYDSDARLELFMKDNLDNCLETFDRVMKKKPVDQSYLIYYRLCKIRSGWYQFYLDNQEMLNRIGIYAETESSEPSEDEYVYFWVDLSEAKTLTFSNLEDDLEILITSGDVALGGKIPAGSSGSINLEYNSIESTSASGKEVTYTYVVLDKENNPITYEISGKTTGSSVISEKDNKLQVCGLKSIEVTCDDSGSEKTAKSANASGGEVEVNLIPEQGSAKILTPTVTPTPTTKVTPTPSRKVTPTKKATPSPTKKVTPIPSKKATPTPTRKATPSPTRIPTKVPSVTPTKAPIKAPTVSPTPIVKVSPTPTIVSKPTSTPVPTNTPTPTNTPLPKPTVTTAPTNSPIPTEHPTDVPTVTPSPTSIPDPSFEDFVERLYVVALNRASEPEGKAFWVEKVVNGEYNGADCARFFLLEAPEFMNRNLSEEDFVETLYKTFFDRESDTDGKKGWVNAIRTGKMSRTDVVNNFIESSEWCNVCATYGVRSGAKWHKAEFASKNAINFATRLYTCCLGREPEKEGLQYWSLALTNLEQTGCTAAKLFFTSEEFVNLKLNDEEYITRLYTTFMDRVPDPAEIAYWEGEIQKGTQSRFSVMAFFGQSPEFTGICKKYGIERGSID